MTIWERIKAALTPLAVPMAANVYIAPTAAELPDLFLTYRLVSAPPEQHANNTELSRTYTVQVTAYNRAGLAGLPDVASAMVAAGFTRGAARELPYSQTTRHFGLVLEFNYLQEE